MIANSPDNHDDPLEDDLKKKTSSQEDSHEWDLENIDLESEDDTENPEDLDDLFDDDPFDKVALDEPVSPATQDIPPKTNAPSSRAEDPNPQGSITGRSKKPETSASESEKQAKQPNTPKRKSDAAKRKTQKYEASDDIRNIDDEIGALLNQQDPTASPASVETTTSADPPIQEGRPNRPLKRAVLKRGIRCPYCEAILPEEDQILITKEKKPLLQSLKEGLKPIEGENPHLVSDLSTKIAQQVNQNPKCPSCKREYIPREIEVASSTFWGNPTSSSGIILTVGASLSTCFLLIQLLAYFKLPAVDSSGKLYDGLSFGLAVLRLGQSAACCVQPLSFLALAAMGFDTIFGTKQDDTPLQKAMTFLAILIASCGICLIFSDLMGITSITEG